MKLQNRKTGEIVELLARPSFVKRDKENYLASEVICFDSLAELNEEWQDYEEPKDSEYYWYIGYKNDIRRTKYHHISDFADNQVTATRKEIGNCFESLEEAELAVRKLKAWKMLKDKGFKFKYWTYKMNEPKIENHTYFMIVGVCEDGARFDDLDLLFSGEEDND